MIKVVMIDIDDTLLSFSESVKEAMREGFSLFGLKPYTEDMYPVFKRINDSLWRQIETGDLTYEELILRRWDMIFRELGIEFDGRIFEDHFLKHLYNSAVPEEGARALLEYLSPRYTLCAASNGPYEQQMNRLKAAKMDGYFTHFFISSVIGAEKPSRLFFDRCFDVLRENGFADLSPEEVMIIGDSVSSDISGGAAYGMRTCLYTKGAVSGTDGCGADHAAGSLSEIIHIL